MKVRSQACFFQLEGEMDRASRSTPSVLTPFLGTLLIIFGGTLGALIGLMSAERQFLPLAFIIAVTVLILGLLPLRRFWTMGLVRGVPIYEVLRWGFLIMLSAAIVGPVASWSGFRSAFAFRLLYVGLCFGAVTWLLLQRQFLLKLGIGGFLTFLAFWLVWAAGSLVWAADKVAGIRYLIFLVMMVSVTVGTVLAVNSLKMLRIALLILLLTFLAAIGVGLLEILTDFRLPTSGMIGVPARFQWRVTSFFYNTNNFATYIALWLPFLIAPAFFTRRVMVLAAVAICTSLSVVCFMRTGSRANLLAVSLVALTLLLALALRRGVRIKWWQVILGIMVLLVAGLAMYLPFGGPFTVLNLPEKGIEAWHIGTLLDQITAGTGSGGARISLITNGLTALVQSGLLGVGPGNAEYHVQRMPGTERIYRLHNWWMEVLVNGGIFVFGGYLIYYGALLYNLFQVTVKAENELLAYAGISLLAALVGYSVGALGPSSAIHFTPMWIHFGLALAVINLFRRCEVKGEA